VSPLSDVPVRADLDFEVPACYKHNPPRLQPGYLSKFKEETLFYIFYSMPQVGSGLIVTLVWVWQVGWEQQVAAMSVGCGVAAGLARRLGGRTAGSEPCSSEGSGLPSRLSCVVSSLCSLHPTLFVLILVSATCCRTRRS
jgi:hypothetical protein